MFQIKILNGYLKQQDQELLQQRYQLFKQYQDNESEIRRLKEVKYQDGFLRDLFVSCLGYTLQPDADYNLMREEKNETDAKQADGAITVDGKIIAVIELKDTSTKDFDRPKTRGKQSAVEQLFGYISAHTYTRYGVVSNFEKLRFYFDKKTEYEEFDLFRMGFDDFAKLHLLLSFESLTCNLAVEIKNTSDKADKDITKTLYNDYADFRRELFENIRKNNLHVDPYKVLRLTQKLVDRIVFILFAEDTALLRKNTIREIRERHQNDIHGSAMYDYYKIYFDAINEGHEKLSITKYNGGLFAKDRELDALIIDDAVLDIQAQELSNYDFQSEVSVNILGHIFEQSLSDLEEINAIIAGEDFDLKSSKRKKEGVFYTPEYITHYIVANTLGTLCETKRKELGLDVEIAVPKHRNRLLKAEKKTLENLQAYRSWLYELKICDPACGSGAFLNQALRFLINEHQNVQSQVALFGDLTAHEEIEKAILEHNLYGVDINEDACEIARLSLWLQTARHGRELTKLSNKIKSGNSLISDNAIDEKAFIWEKEFPEVFDQGGFDIIIGNPPYVRQELLDLHVKEYFKAQYHTYHGMADLYVFFVEKGYSLLKENGRFSYIFPNKWMRANYGSPLRTWLEDKKIEEIIDFGDLNVFEDATTYPIIMTLRRSNDVGMFRSLELNTLDFSDLGEYVRHQHKITDQKRLHVKGWSLADVKVQNLLANIESKGVPLGEYVNGEIYRGVLTGLNEAFVVDEATKNRLISEDAKSAEIIKPFLAGRDIQRYQTPKADKFLILFPKGWTREQSGIEDEITAWQWLQKEYPAIFSWFLPFIEKAKKRYDKGEFWWELRACEYYEAFEKEKMIYLKFQVNPAFVFDENSCYSNDANFIFPKKDFYLLGILNSKLGWFLISHTCTEIQNGYQLIFDYFKQVSIATCNNALLKKEFEDKVEVMLLHVKELQLLRSDFTDYCTHVLSIEKLTKKLLSPEKLTLDELTKELKKKKVAIDDFNIFKSIKDLHVTMMQLKQQIDAIDAEIDNLVYQLYGLSDEEIHTVQQR